MSSKGELSEMREAQLPSYRGEDLEPEEISLRLSNAPVREHLEEMAEEMQIAKAVVAGHALAHLIAKASTKKAANLLDERSAVIKKHGNPSRTEVVYAPGPVIDWVKAAATRLKKDPRAIVETAIELWYEAWPGRKKAKKAGRAA